MAMTLREKYGEWALVTGASAGIGEAFARRLAAEGLKVIVTARREERLRKLARELQDKHGTEVRVCAADLSRDEFFPSLVEATENLEVGILVNNAGYAISGPFVRNDPQADADLVKVNCVAPTLLARHFLMPMVKRRRGAIIFLSSTVSAQPTPFWTSYSASKVFNFYMALGLRRELKGSGVDVLAVLPGATDTEFQSVARMKRLPLSRTPEQVVSTALAALGRKGAVIDGLHNKLMVFVGRHAPRSLAAYLAGGSVSRITSWEKD
jgi:uncharacterized protein